MFQPPSLAPRPSVSLVPPPLAPVPSPLPLPRTALALGAIPPQSSPSSARPPLSANAMPLPMPLPQPLPIPPVLNAPPQRPVKLPTLAEVNHCLFVSGIAPGVSDEALLRILGTCGKVLIWKRPLDNTGAFCSFGFCVYESPASLLKALRVIEGEEEAFIGGIELEGENGGLKRLRLSVSPAARLAALEYVERQKERVAQEKKKSDISTVAIADPGMMQVDEDSSKDDSDVNKDSEDTQDKDLVEEDEEMEEGEERVASPEDHRAYAEIQGILESLKAEKAEAFLSSLAQPEEPVPSQDGEQHQQQPQRKIPKDISEISLNPHEEEDPLSDLPPEITPEQKMIIRKEIKLFRENTAEKDKERREMEQAIVLESRRRVERELERERERKYRDEARRGSKKKGASTSTEAKKPVAGSRLILSKEDEEEERILKEKKAEERRLLFIEQETKWIAYEESRSKRLAVEEKSVKEYEAKRVESTEKALAWLKAYSDDKEMETDDFFTAHDRWAFRRERDRRREEEEDARDVALEAREKEESAKQKPIEAPQVVGRIMTKDERTLAMKELVDKIPADKDGLFSWPVQWSFVTPSLIESKLKPFVAKKVVEYIGEEMADVVDHVVKAISKRTSAEGLFKEMEAALGEDADIFVMKLWRILVYETEARAQGIL